MKLASYQDGSRDGQLVVVSRDLSQAHYATHVANRLQQVMDDWNFLSPLLQDLYDALNAGRARHAFPFDPARCLAPLPRAYQLVLAPHAAEPGQPLPWLQGAGDRLRGPLQPLPPAPAGGTLRWSAGVAALTGDIAANSTPERALDGVRLLTLGHMALLSPQAEAASTAAPRAWVTRLGPVAVSPDCLGSAWRDGAVQLPLLCRRNGRLERSAGADADARPHLGRLLADVARGGALGAGSVVLAGLPMGPAEASGRAGVGAGGGAGSAPDGSRWEPTDALQFEMQDAAGQSVFGAISPAQPD